MQVEANHLVDQLVGRPVAQIVDQRQGKAANHLVDMVQHNL